MLKKVKTEAGGISFKESQKWSDFAVVSPAGKLYPCHRIILANKSSFFRMILSNENVENTDKKITLQFYDPNDVFPTLLEYFYSNELEINEDNVVDLYSLADALLLESVKTEALHFFQEILDIKVKFKLFFKALEFKCEPLIGEILEHFATCFERLDPEADFWISCPLEYLIQLFNSPKLALTDELKLWQFVNLLLRKRPDLRNEKPEHQRQLIEVVKYPLISSDILLQLITEQSYKTNQNDTNHDNNNNDNPSTENTSTANSDHTTTTTNNNNSSNSTTGTDTTTNGITPVAMDITTTTTNTTPPTIATTAPPTTTSTTSKTLANTTNTTNNNNSLQCSQAVSRMVRKYAQEALQARALFLEGFQSLAEKTPWKYLQRYHFELRNAGAFFPEEGGLFEWLGRDKNQSAEFNTATLLKYIKLSSSALHPDVAAASACFRGHSFKLKNSQMGHIQFEFGSHAPRYYKVRAYTFKHGNFYRQNDRTECFMRNWVLEGSRDGKTWFVLDSKTNDTTVQAKNTFYTFPIEPPVAGIVAIKLRSTGPDDHGHLALCFLDLDLLYTK